MKMPSFVVARGVPFASEPDRWFAVDRFEKVGDATARVIDDEALAMAESLTRRALALGSDSAEEAVGLHLRAAVLRRDGGRPATSVENLIAITSHLLGAGDRRQAVAYMRKLVHVASLATDAGSRYEAFYQAAETYIAVGRPSAATAMTSKGAADAARLADLPAMRRGMELMERVQTMPPVPEGSCGCGGTGPYETCCGIGDREPVEYLVEPVNPYTTVGSGMLRRKNGFDLLMDDPGPAGEPEIWASWTVEGGTHKLITFPNWSGRALRAARKMVDASVADLQGTSGPAATVMQAVCAAEAFINAVAYFLRQGGEERWKGFGLPHVLFQDSATYLRGPLTPRWRDIGGGLLGDVWLHKARTADLELLTRIRVALVHFHGDYHGEVIAPFYGLLPEWLDRVPDDVEVRDPPGPWIDRLLTPSLAQWSVTLVEGLISSFRSEWAVLVASAEDQEKKHDLLAKTEDMVGPDDQTASGDQAGVTRRAETRPSSGKQAKGRVSPDRSERVAAALRCEYGHVRSAHSKLGHLRRNGAIVDHGPDD